MPIECAHLLESGQKCKAPAVIGGSLCRHHQPGKPANELPFEMPAIEDKSGLLFVVLELVEALFEHRINRSDARTLFAGLQLAFKLMSDIDKDVNTAVRNGRNIDDRWTLDRTKSPIKRNQPVKPAPSGSDETVLQEAQAFLTTAQTSSVERALEEWLAKDSSPSQPQQNPLSKRPTPSRHGGSALPRLTPSLNPCPSIK